MGKLTPNQVLNADPGRLADGDGLYVLTKPTGAQTWLLRVQVDGKRRDIGLGTVDRARLVNKKGGPPPLDLDAPILQRKLLTLAEAREKAKILHHVAKSGLDPVTERDKVRKSVPTFREAAKATHAALKPGWAEKGGKTFIRSLENHTFTAIGDKAIDTITAADITAVLKVIWMTKPDMARKVRQRIGKVLNFAHGQGWRSTEAPSRSVTASLPRQPQGEHYKAMPYEDVPSLVAKLWSETPTKGRRALLLHILAASRPGEVRRARWGQFNFAKRDWNRPKEIMKGVHKRAHTVTLNLAAVKLLHEIKAELEQEPNPEDLVFPGQRGALLSDMTLTKVLRTAGHPYDVHGFRSSFRDWAAEKMPHINDAVAEAAIAHIEGSKVKRAYLRTGYVEQRRELLETWGEFVTGEIMAITSGDNV